MKQMILETIAKIHRPHAGLVDYLEDSDFFTAPAASTPRAGEAARHNSMPGGLAAHSWNVYRQLDLLNKQWEFASEESVIICGLFHDLCKVNFYKEGTRNEKGADGKWNTVKCYLVDDALPFGHGEKSALIASRFMSLNDAELLAIRWHMGAWNAGDYTSQKGLNQAIDRYPLVRALIIADQIAAYLVEREPLRR